MDVVDAQWRPNLVVALVGLPGSGKSRAAAGACAAPVLDGVHVQVVSFDDFPDVASASELAVDRPRALQRVRELCVARRHASPPTMVIVDDNLYYRSMRKEVYRIARDAGWAYLQVQFAVPLETALSRNTQRSGRSRVPDCVVRSMSERFEPPTQKGWDKAVPFTGAPDELAALLVAHWPSAPPPPTRAPAPATAAASTSAAHELDIALRRETHALVSAAPAHKRKELAARLAVMRRDLLSREHESVAAAVEALHSCCIAGADNE